MLRQRLFIVEDDTVISQMIQVYFQQWGFETYGVKKFNHVAEEVFKVNPDLIIMDINLPYYNGFYWLTEVRKLSKIPVVFLTSSGDDTNLIMAMNMGADDFIAKPVELTVLLAKVKGLLRRTYEYQIGEMSLTVADYELIPSDNTLHNHHQEVTLTPTETKIMTLLFRSVNEIITRDELMEKLWAADEYIDRNALSVNMTRLRKRLSVVGLDKHIETIKGQGYQLTFENRGGTE